MVDVSVPVARVRAHAAPPPKSGQAPRTLHLEPAPRSQPLWRFALIGLGPLGVMCLIAGGAALVQQFGS